MPLGALLPAQPLEAMHPAASLAVQVKVALPPWATVLGLALMLMAGVGALTETVADCVALPPLPVQVSVYVALAARAPVDCEPLRAVAPDQAPDARHSVALPADQFSVELPPWLMLLGATAKCTMGAGALTDTVADCVALPLEPAHVRI